MGKPGFTKEEKAAMREHAKELKAQAAKADGEKMALDKIAEMPESDRKMATRIHEIIKEIAPQMAAKTWYGMPAYTLDDKIICFFQAADKFKYRYATLGFNEAAKLDEGTMWATSFALTEITPEAEKKIRKLILQAISA